MQWIAWTLTGLAAGWLVRWGMRSRRDFGLIGDLITGWLGGVVGGWLFRQLGVTAPNAPVGHVMVALVGAAVLLAFVRVLRSATSAAGVTAPIDPPPLFADLEQRLRGLGQLERRILQSLFEQRPTARDPNLAFDAQSTFGERVADRVAQFGGSWTFIGLFLIGMVSWMAMNQDSGLGFTFDPFPFILLNLILSCLAALQAPIIMMSQNRQSAKDRSDARNDYEVNVRSELQITALHAKVDALRDEEIRRLTELVVVQQQHLERLRQEIDRAGSTGA